MNSYPTDANGILLDPNGDGINHINIYSKGRTNLGMLLSPFTFTPFKVDSYGDFNSLEGYYHWVSTGMQHDQFRFVYGLEAKRLGKAFPKVPNDKFVEIISSGIHNRLLCNPEILKLLIETELPLTHYYVLTNNYISYPAKHQYLADIHSLCRQTHRRL